MHVLEIWKHGASAKPFSKLRSRTQTEQETSFLGVGELIDVGHSFGLGLLFCFISFLVRRLGEILESFSFLFILFFHQVTLY